MSITISQCLIVMACTDEKAYEKLLSDMKYNLGYGHWSLYPCECITPHVATDEQLKKLQTRINNDLKPLNFNPSSSNKGVEGVKGIKESI